MASLYEDLAKTLFNIQPAPSVEGTWGPTTGFLGYINPFSRDYGGTELARELAGKTPSGELTTKFNNPAVYNQPAVANTSFGTYKTVAPGAPLPSGWNTSTTADSSNDDGWKTDPKYRGWGEAEAKADYAATGGSGGGSGPSMAEIIAQQRAQAKLAYERGLRNAKDAFNRARGMYDEAMGILGTRREEFENAFNQGNQDITQEYQKRGGELGTSAQNRKMKDLAALQAMGLNGSALERAQGMRMRDQIRAQSELMDNRNKNQVTNKNVWDTNKQWALGQEGAINRALEQAESDRRNAEGFAYENYLGNISGIDRDMRSYMDSIQQHQNAMQAAGLANQSYQANSFTPNISDFSGLLQSAQAKAPQAVAATGDQASNVALSPYALSELDRLKKAGVYGGGLYNA